MVNRNKLGFILGPLLFLGVYFAPFFPDNPAAHRLLAIFLLTVVFWVTECIPIPITALQVPVFIAIFKIAPAQEAFAPFANPIIMLFLGSFILARAMCVHALDRKLAFSVLSIRSIGHSKTRVLFALGLTSLFLSMWISNTATTAMMYPIALGVMDAFHTNNDKKGASSFRIILLLTLAYAASVGGIGTPIGSPPNLIAIGMLEKLVDYKVTFFQWMIIGFLVLIPMYFFLFFLMKLRLKDKEKTVQDVDLSSLQGEKTEKKLTKGQRNVLFAFSTTVFLWVFPGFVALVWGRDAALSIWMSEHFPESIAAIIGAGILFFLPARSPHGIYCLGRLAFPEPPLHRALRAIRHKPPDFIRWQSGHVFPGHVWGNPP